MSDTKFIASKIAKGLLGGAMFSVFTIGGWAVINQSPFLIIETAVLAIAFMAIFSVIFTFDLNPF